jgi:hypothetical protein
VVQEPPKAVRETVAEVPAEVDALLAELLAKDPAARPPTATALRARVEELFLRLGGAGLATAGGGRGGAKWAVGLLLLGAAGGAVWWFGTDRSAPPTDGGNPALETSEPEPETVLRPANDPGAAVAAEENDVEPSLGAEEARLQAVEREAERALRATESVADDAEREAALRELATTFGGTTAATEALERAEALALARAAANAAAGTAPVPTSAELVRQGARAATRDAAGALLPPEIAHDQLARWPLPIGVAPGPEVAAVLEELVRELDAELRAASDARLAEADQQLLAGEFDAAEEGYEALHAWLRELPERLRAERAAAEAAHRASLEAPVDPAAPPVVVPPPPEPVYRLAERVALVESRLDRLDDWRELHAEALRQRDLKTLAAALPGGPFEQSLRRFDFDGALAALRAVYQQLQSPRYRQALEQRTVDLQGAADCFRWLEESFAAGGWRRSNVPIPGERRGVGEARAVQASGLVAVVDGAPRDVAWAEFATEVDALVQLFDGRLTRELEPAERAGLAHLLCAAAWNLTLARVDPIFDPGRRGRLTENEAEQIQKAFGRAREMAAAAGTNDLERIASEQLAAEHLCLALRAVERGDPATAAFGFEQLLDAAPTAQLTLLLSDGRPAGLPASWPPELPGVDELPTPAAGEPR